MLLAASLLSTILAPVDSGIAISRLNDVPTLTLSGQPFIIAGAQCDIWRSTRQDEATLGFLDGYQAMNATTVGLGIPWSCVETDEDVYDFAFIDWFITQAEKRGLKLILHLFSTNICGKVFEAHGGGMYPQYAPTYILDQPERFQRMALGDEGQYAWGGPPMCPNDPDTLAREAAYLRRVAEHLRDTDALRTVIMVQIDNEFYYQQWLEAPPDPARVRCHCPNCEAKVSPEEGEERFMFRSLAEYAAGVSRAFREVYDLPVYVNSPWWPVWVVELFLQTCPAVDLVGIDGVLSPREPNQLSDGQVDRNIAFAAECPTEHDETRRNLGVLPYYVLLNRQGIGNLLWEAGPPKTVVEDPDARRRYGEALYPLKNAMEPVLNARGTDRLIGWYAVEMSMEVPPLERDVFGNVQTSRAQTQLRAARIFVREGLSTREAEGSTFATTAGGHAVTVSGSTAGLIVELPDGELLIATPGGVFEFGGPDGPTAEAGVFEGDVWRPGARAPIESVGAGRRLTVAEPSVIILRW